eukprot:CAMPEP_0201100814 /NCGR_PEP_ID=MMETSP0812-20130820/9646_1 /ASSEMBLY_ACC=CAM_ASM_000668 /TAXON_ID=98059 /ORGANISM="Dinobryon sp., Strain UTEXLB2267" /LENGTH=106 /DNA_ID=CAMNT_0047357333 /DNA_START=71 /DNA_END=391 /DNA_ORIENTATION=+
MEGGREESAPSAATGAHVRPFLAIYRPGDTGRPFLAIHASDDLTLRIAVRVNAETCTISAARDTTASSGGRPLLSTCPIRRGSVRAEALPPHVSIPVHSPFFLSIQ